VRGIAQISAETFSSRMALYRNLWKELCSHENLQVAFRKARKHKTLKPCVVEFEENLAENLSLLRTELLFHIYQPRPLETFILRDPKTRKISKSDFRDRVIHHALCNIIEPMFEKCFIYDSYANRKGKGTLNAIQRYDFFARKVSENYTVNTYALKADIRHYFDEVEHSILCTLIQRKVKDPKIMWLIKRILGNYSTAANKGMPLGNLTSQFFANVYLNELDYFVKQNLNVKYYIRYVDDFVLLHTSPTVLQEWKKQIALFLHEKLRLQLHPDKSKIIPLSRGVEFLGFNVFPHHRLLKRKNMRHFQRKVQQVHSLYHHEMIIYDDVYNFMEGWCAHAKNANTFKRRQHILSLFEEQYPHEISIKEINRGLSKKKKSN